MFQTTNQSCIIFVFTYPIWFDHGSIMESWRENEEMLSLEEVPARPSTSFAGDVFCHRLHVNRVTTETCAWNPSHQSDEKTRGKRRELQMLLSQDRSKWESSSNHSRVVIWSGAGCAWHEDGVKFAMRVQRAANCIEGQTRLTLMCCACQVGTFGCAALVGLRTSDLSSTLWAASCCTVVGNRNLVLLVVFNLMIDQPNEQRTPQNNKQPPRGFSCSLELEVGMYRSKNGPKVSKKRNISRVQQSYHATHLWTSLKLSLISLHVQQELDFA